MTPKAFRRRGPWRITIACIAGLLVWLTTTTVVGVHPAAACSCATGTVSDMEGWSDIGFVGSLISRDEPPKEENENGEYESSGQSNTAHRFAIEQWIYNGPDSEGGSGEVDTGDLDTDEITIYSPASGGACGFELRTGERAAIFANRRGDRFTGGLCSTMPADVALAEIEPAVINSGVARLTVFGNFDGALAAYFDVDGRFLGYEGSTDGITSWQPWPVTCEDGLHAASLDGLSVRVLSLAVAEDVREPVTIKEDVGPTIARCGGPDDVVVLEQTISGGLQSRDLQTGETSTVLDRASGTFAATNQGIAVVEHLDPGERLLLIEGSGPDRTEREIGRLDRTTEDSYRGYVTLATALDGTALGVLEGDYQGEGVVESTLRIIDPATGEEIVSRIFNQESWGAQWIDEDHIGITFGSDDVHHIEVLDATTLASVGQTPGWTPSQTVFFEGALWGVEDGTLYRGEFDQEPEALFTLPARTSSPVMVMAEPVEKIAPAPTEQTTTTTEAATTEETTTTTAPPPSTATSTSDESEQAISNADGPADGGVDTVLVGGGLAGGGVALTGLLLFRQVRQRRESRTTSDV